MNSGSFVSQLMASLARGTPAFQKLRVPSSRRPRMGQRVKVESSRWLLVVEFDDHQTQRDSDVGLGFPDDEASQFVAQLRTAWELLPEDIGDHGLVNFTDNEVMASADVLDYLQEPIDWLLMNTRPKSISLVRTEPR